MWVLAIVDPAVYAMPYIIALLVCVAVFSGVILKFKSIRSFRNKCSLIVYAVVALVGVLLVFLAYDAGLGPTHISYDFAFASNNFSPEELNQFNVTSSNRGIRPASYNLVLHSINASFSEENSPTYCKVDNSTIKIPFTFSEAKQASLSKPVLFTINSDVSGFLVDVSLESGGYSNVLVITCTSSMLCSYNSTLNSYTIESMVVSTA